MEDVVKICRGCGINKLLSEFAEYARGKKRTVCKKCYSKDRADKHKNDRRDFIKNNKINMQRRLWRQNPKNRTTVIYQDCRNGDKKKLKTTNDLTKDFITSLIKNGCQYCGETELQITLDRIDNSLPHNQNNVNSACIRCNLIRREMPYECWIHIVPSIKSAKERGLFDTWVNKFKKDD